MTKSCERLLHVFLASVLLIGGIRTTARCASFGLEHLDESRENRIGGVLLVTPSGDLIATDRPASGQWVGIVDDWSTYRHEEVRILLRHAGVWSPIVPQPPQDSTMQHDLAMDSTGKLYFLNWQAPGRDECRPILQEQVPGGWNTTVMDTGTVLHAAIAIGPDDQPWIAMLRAMKEGWATHYAMVIAHRTASGWLRDSLDLPGSPMAWNHVARPPFGLDSQSRPHFLFSSEGLPGLMHATRTGAGWQVDTVDASVRALGFSAKPSLAFDASGQPRVLYADGSMLRFSTWTGSGWSTELVASDFRGGACALEIDATNVPCALYSTELLDPEAPHGGLYYSRKHQANWPRTFVNDDSSYNWSPQLRFDASGSPLVLHNDPAWRMTTLASAWLTAGTESAPHERPLGLSLRSSNPSRIGSALEWALTTPTPSEVTLECYDVSGRLVATSPTWIAAAGSTWLRWSTGAERTGVYFVRARTTSGATHALRCVLVK